MSDGPAYAVAVPETIDSVATKSRNFARIVLTISVSGTQDDERTSNRNIAASTSKVQIAGKKIVSIRRRHRISSASAAIESSSDFLATILAHLCSGERKQMCQQFYYEKDFRSF